MNAGGREGLSGLSVAMSRLVQVEPILRSAKVKTFARQNRSWSISFSFAREYATLEDAHETASDFIEGLPDSGDLEFEQTGDNAAVQSTIYEGAVLQSAVPAQMGKTVIFSFAFVAHSRKVTPP